GSRADTAGTPMHAPRGAGAGRSTHRRRSFRAQGSTLMKERLTVIVSGMVAGTPHQGGATWAVLQYLLGLRKLGHDVYLVEPVDALDAVSVAYADAVMAGAGLSDRWALVERDTRCTAGLDYEELRSV